MKTALMFVANGSEDMETVITYDILTRAGISVTMVSIEETPCIITSHNLKIETTITIDELSSVFDYNILILPGGMGVEKVKTQQNVVDLVKQYHKKGKYISAICAAPIILQEAGIMKGVNFTCFPGFEQDIEGIYHKDKKLVVDKNIITAKSASCTFEFAFKIVELLCGQEVRNKVADKIYY